MAFHYPQLDLRTREFMLAEMRRDDGSGRLYGSVRFTEAGNAAYPGCLVDAITTGSDESLATSLAESRFWAPTELRDGKPVKVRRDANVLFSQSEFSQFYARAICLRALEHGTNAVKVYRARESSRPRPESEALIGTSVPATTLLDDLRSNRAVDKALGLASVGSGINVVCPCDTCSPGGSS